MTIILSCNINVVKILVSSGISSQNEYNLLAITTLYNGNLVLCIKKKTLNSNNNMISKISKQKSYSFMVIILHTQRNRLG